MKDDSRIPLLQDLLFKGNTENEQEPVLTSEEEQIDIDFDQRESQFDHSNSQQSITDEDEHLQSKTLAEENSATQLPENIEQEIHRIMDKHMNKAYAKIIKLLQEKSS